MIVVGMALSLTSVGILCMTISVEERRIGIKMGMERWFKMKEGKCRMPFGRIHYPKPQSWEHENTLGINICVEVKWD